MSRGGAPGVSFHDFSAGGQVGGLIRDKDWSETPLGPLTAWPRSLSNYLSMILELPTAAIIFWGPDQIQLYNDGYSVIMGPRHPQHLGSRFRDCWPEAYPTIDPWMQRVLLKGETVQVIRTLVPLTRFGFTEEAYFTFSFSPLRDDQGMIAGILQLVTEVTDLVIGERRAAALHELSQQTARAKTMQDATRLSAEVLAKQAADLPFCLIYTADADDRDTLTLAASTGLAQDQQLFPSQLDVGAGGDPALPEVTRAVSERTLIPIENMAARFGRSLSGGAGAEPTLGFAAPIAAADGQSVVAVLVGGISPQLALDEPYRAFLQLICAQLATLMTAARAYDDERKRAEALAEIDRAKTEFFSNVSHEFRTPLTLILGPLEDALRDPASLLQGEALEAVHRNALRLLRLVNTLLDFSRAEAGREQRAFQAVDLPLLTAGLAGSFQSLLEGAGLRLVVDCPALPDVVYVDRSHWEKIVLNLVSNAFKFTFEGEISVRLSWHGDHVELAVKDTGTGIPAAELPRIFERFHRVEGARGRSFEGTGIGLALVQELVQMHGGSVSVTSVEGQGTTFVVSIPTGSQHLPQDRIVHPRGHAADAATVESYLLEADRWGTGSAATPKSASRASDTVILVADDNADMRRYLVRLLEPHWSVETVPNGEAALAFARSRAPDLILTDVMMPVMDGVTLLRELRADPVTSSIPIILLSARAGQEAVLGGLETGADDYLVKPFSARELLSRVRTLLHMVRIREEAQTQLIQSAKMASLGELVAGVAHEINNPLAFAVSHVGTIAKSLEQIEAGLAPGALESEKKRWGRVADRLRELHDGLGRIRELVVKLRTFSRLDEGELKPVSIRQSVESVITILAHRLKPEMRVTTELSEPDEVICYAGLLNQAIMNLVSNAIDAVGDKGSITISAGERGGWFSIAVADDGHGIPDSIRDRVLEPFFTTKAVGQGTGLGLSITYSIVKKHHGELELAPRPGGGTIATLRFPLRAQ